MVLTIRFVMCKNDFTAKDDWQLVLQVIILPQQVWSHVFYSATYIFKCTCIKCLLETNLATSAKPTNNPTNVKTSIFSHLIETGKPNRPVAGGGTGGARAPPQKFSDLNKILLQKWNFSTKMDSCQWNLKFQSIVVHSKIMYCCSSGPSCSKAD